MLWSDGWDVRLEKTRTRVTRDLCKVNTATTFSYVMINDVCLTGTISHVSMRPALSPVHTELSTSKSTVSTCAKSTNMNTVCRIQLLVEFDVDVVIESLERVLAWSSAEVDSLVFNYG